MTVLTREVLESSSLADLHALAGELAIDGFRRLRREDLVDSITARRGGSTDTDSGSDERNGGRRRRRGGRSDESTTDEVTADSSSTEDRGPRRRRRGGDEQAEGGRDRDRRSDRGERSERGDRHERSERSDRGERSERSDRSERSERGDRRPDGETGPSVEGVISVTANGSAMLKTDDGSEVYVSAGQIRRCEIVDGDRVSGPTRPARNSERYPSLVRVETINGKSADEAAPGTRFEDLAVVRPSELLALESDDPTVAAIAWLTPLGRGSRAVITGPHAAGKSEALRRLGIALKAVDGLELLPVLAGVRPEEIADWRAAGLDPVVAIDLASGPDQRAKAIDEVVERGRRTAARGGHAVLLIDTLDGLGEGSARRILSAARKLEAGGSLTIIATREAPAGGESTVVRLDHALTSTGRFPSLDLATSGTLRPELLVGDEGAKAIAAARLELR